jgi:hypothetical protein
LNIGVKPKDDGLFLDSRPRPHDSIYQDFDVIFGDHRLGVNVHRVLADIADASNVDEWDLKSQAWEHKPGVFA